MKKSNITVSTCDNCDNLFYEINDSFSDWPDYIFRGHSQSDWLLESTLTRALSRINSSDKNALVIDHLDRFKLQIRGRRGLHPKDLSENELWALGQHFGLYTPLLDWSQSAYVALFFALTSLKKSPTGYRSLWALHSPDIDKINEWHKKRKKNYEKWTVELVNPIQDENYRLVNQNGLFTKISIENSIEKWVSEGPEYDWSTLHRIDFPDNLRDKAIAYLDLMNINYTSLFPDLFGSSMNTNIKLEQIDYIEKRQKEVWEEFNKLKSK